MLYKWESVRTIKEKFLTLTSKIKTEMKKILSIALFAMASIITFAQKPVIEFEELSYDFGDIQEKGGRVTHVFTYKNTGTTPLIINNVQASCGCTTPEWTRKPIKAGDKGEIKVTYDPINRPGSFNKTITVNANTEKPTTMLRISGNVLQRPKTVEDLYPVVMDSLRLENSHIPFTKMKPNEQKTAELKVINTSSSAVTPNFINIPAHVKIECRPATIEPGQKAVIVATYDAALKNDWGYVSDRIYMTFSDQRKYNNSITLSASIEEDFSNTDAQNTPVFEVNEKTHDFGEINPSVKAVYDFVVTNTGKDNLIIRKVKASCGCTAATPEKKVLTKGESTNIHVEFDPRGKSGRQSKTITVITNDPKNSNVLLRITGNITPQGQQMK